MTCCSAPGVADVMSSPFGLSDDSPVYVISVAAQLAGLHPQTLRYYDKLGLVSPGRSSGRGRRYSLRDVLALREVQRLSQEEGINLSGIKRILELQGDLRRHQQLLTWHHRQRRGYAQLGLAPAAEHLSAAAAQRQPQGQHRTESVAVRADVTSKHDLPGAGQQPYGLVPLGLGESSRGGYLRRHESRSAASSSSSPSATITAGLR